MTFSLDHARLYLCTDARRSPDELRHLVRECFAGGVDIIQIRDKSLEARAELEALAVVAEEAQRADRLVAANDRADLAVISGAHVLHVGQGDLTPDDAHRLAPDALIGMSTHDTGQLRAAIDDARVDYFCVGPLWATPTKPGRRAVGLELVEAAATAQTTKPWFAIGGINDTTLPDVIAAGATRAVVVRALTEADDPRAAARRLRDMLERS